MDVILLSVKSTFQTSQQRKYNNSINNSINHPADRLGPRLAAVNQDLPCHIIYFK